MTLESKMMSQASEKSLEKKEQEKNAEVSYEGCSAVLPKGGVVDPEKKLAEGVLVSDTGAFASFLQKYQNKSEFTPEAIDQIYKETIAGGVIDHHSIDAFFHSKKVQSKKCSTRMVADYAEEVLKMIKDKKIKNVETHFDSDEDAVCSVYLIKHLIEHGQLPAIADDLAEVANKEDYGEFDLPPEKYINTFPGIFSSIKSELDRQASAKLGVEVFSNPDCKDPKTGWLNAEGAAKLGRIKAESERMINESVFAVLNAANNKKNADPDFKLDKDLSVLLENLPDKLQKIIAAGKEIFAKNLEEFEKDYESAEKIQAIMKNKKGEDMEVTIIAAQSKNPLMFTSIAYQRISPECIVAVYAGSDRKGGDQYDIGITPDQANVIDMSDLCLALNQAEKEKRDAVYAKPEGKRTDEEKKLLDAWESQPDRDTIARSIIVKDPTVLVAGGSLIAASRTSLLDPEDFKKALKEFEF